MSSGPFSPRAPGSLTRLGYGNGSYTNWLKDAAGRLTLVANMKSDASAISTFGYTLDGAGMRRTMAIGGSAYTAASVAYEYDGAYQLTKETRTGGSAYTQSFAYDWAGKRTKAVLGAATTQYYYNGMGELTKYGTNAVTWDGDGNVTRIGDHKENGGLTQPAVHFIRAHLRHLRTVSPLPFPWRPWCARWRPGSLGRSDALPNARAESPPYAGRRESAVGASAGAVGGPFRRAASRTLQWRDAPIDAAG